MDNEDNINNSEAWYINKHLWNEEFYCNLLTSYLPKIINRIYKVDFSNFDIKILLENLTMIILIY